MDTSKVLKTLLSHGQFVAMWPATGEIPVVVEGALLLGALLLGAFLLLALYPTAVTAAAVAAVYVVVEARPGPLWRLVLSDLPRSNPRALGCTWTPDTQPSVLPGCELI